MHLLSIVPVGRQGLWKRSLLSKLKIKRNFLTMRVTKQSKNQPPELVGAPTLEVSSNVQPAICLGWSEDFCFGYGVELEDLHVLFQSNYSIILKGQR